ncbi:unnamed protein product, partial [marine sediment metagenome]
IMFFMFEPNTPTHIGPWNDNYTYRYIGYNFAKYSTLEDSFYFAQSALSGEIPSKGYHPSFFSFLIGLILKIFNSNYKSFFILNYIFSFSMFIVLYFYSRERLDRLELYIFLIILSLSPAVLIFTNVIMMEILFLPTIPLIYFLYFKNKQKYFNYQHIICLLLLPIMA